MQYGLKEQTIDQIQITLKKFPEVEEAILYGSRAMGTNKPGSDIDLTLKGEKLSLKVLNKINLALDDLLLPVFFDVSIYQQIDNQNLVEHIKRVGKVIYMRV